MIRQRQPEKLDPVLVVRAYAQGIFPMADERGKINWYAPDPRAILEHERFHVSRSLRATWRKQPYQIRMDTVFEQVMHCCGGREDTWINQEFITTYTYLHYKGLAHCVEAWDGDKLVGGLYGVALGGAFMGESMFSSAPDASKLCLIALVEHLRSRGYILHDTQFITPHLASMGVIEIPRLEYERRLQQALQLHCQW
ncbi:leucyl/phenylalanyl-tRNA--protein transferase [Dictyobacter alpinus]|uniref:Leucyl/phenylalanyl-tRNA--protein transferase n=1 Tax=Dictyobacter alpinus TaxID=2014873 RepID=A0A402B9G6_9CHLR|nr:leucyl/phenylalanyl-tRNA--protein transferase [Dictyobacter alpinus]GCE28021.1 leucyl/phenylalanyl-tRNA--protein transferase [Dictyobacter alpinus]